MQGIVVQIVGPVVDVRFKPETMPKLYNALVVEDGDIHVTLEVSQHVGNDLVRCIAMGATEGLSRGLKVTDLGTAIKVPVGKAVLGRMFNVLGEPIDEMPFDKEGVPFHEIHREAPLFKDQKTTNTVLETGIKVIDLLCP